MWCAPRDAETTDGGGAAPGHAGISSTTTGGAEPGRPATRGRRRALDRFEILLVMVIVACLAATLVISAGTFR